MGKRFAKLLRFVAVWLVCLAAAEAVGAPAFPVAAGAVGDAQLLQGGPDIEELDEERLPPSGLHADMLANTPLCTRRGHGCRGDDQVVPASPDAGRLLRPPRPHG
ncbi:MAG: hypothetical protein FJ100_16460 [Deltaproteobacteria bacterium]|nr:hypothetical protein [Deltaproteobacteria bacterium]